MIFSKRTVLLFILLAVFDISAYKIGSFVAEISHSLYNPLYKPSLLYLTYQHICMVMLATAISSVVGVFLGIIATRDSLSDLLLPVNLISSASQSFPPVAVIALLVPIIGFGAEPIMIALFVYGLFPIVQNTIGGIKGIDSYIKDASIGMGMGWFELLFTVEIPLAFNKILSGIKTSLTVNVGVAAIGAVVGAGGLGAPIISGLINENQFYIAYGSISVALLAVLFNGMMDDIERFCGLKL